MLWVATVAHLPAVAAAAVVTFGMKLAINVMEMAVLCVRKQKQASLVANICILARSIKKKLGMRINVLSGGAIKI
jgi:hypothetical protein